MKLSYNKINQDNLKQLSELASSVHSDLKQFEDKDFIHPRAVQVFICATQFLSKQDNILANIAISSYWLKQLDQYIYLTELLQVFNQQDTNNNHLDFDEDFDEEISEEEFFDYWSSGHFAQPLNDLMTDGMDIIQATNKLKPLQEETLIAYCILHFPLAFKDLGITNEPTDDLYPLTYHALFEIGDSTQALHLGFDFTRYPLPQTPENFPFITIDFFNHKDQVLHITNNEKNIAIQAIKSPSVRNLHLLVGHELSADEDFSIFQSQWSDKTSKALDILQYHAEDAFECFKSFTRTLVSNDQEHIVSYSLQDIPYVSTINLIHRDDIDYLDDLIHENGHHFLNSLLNLDELIIEDDEKIFFSPWRNAKRPIRGLYHAYCTFAWAKILFASLTKKVIESSDPKDLLAPYIPEMNNSQIQKIVFRFLEETIMLNHCKSQLDWAYRVDNKITDAGQKIVSEFTDSIDRYKDLEEHSFEWIKKHSALEYEKLISLDRELKKQVESLNLR